MSCKLFIPDDSVHSSFLGILGFMSFESCQNQLKGASPIPRELGYLPVNPVLQLPGYFWERANTYNQIKQEQLYKICVGILQKSFLSNEKAKIYLKI